MAVSLKVLTVVAVLVFVCGFAAGWFARVPAPAQPEERDLVIGALLPLSGDLSFAGDAGQAGLELAIEDVNTYLADCNAELRVRVIIEDTQTSPEVAQESLQELAGKDVSIVLGPESSAEVEAVQAYAAENGIVLLSQGST
ncbi:MAG: ABC transporter substrate-binding protein, partial [Methanomicrobia archaeon]|nr:ABC transporter substrate-binding protein [Methanomicrobia archaeon]